MTLNMTHVKVHVFLKYKIVKGDSSYMQDPLMFSKICFFFKFNFLITHTHHIFQSKKHSACYTGAKTNDGGNN